jgi:diguanylate cyclase
MRITVSVGLAVSEPGTTVSQLLARADGALYAAKHAGKNRVRSDKGVGSADRGASD